MIKAAPSFTFQKISLKKIRKNSSAYTPIILPAAPAVTQQRATVEDQTHVQALGYNAVPNFFKPPKGEYFGETQGIATNSKGHVFVYFRDPDGSLLEFISYDTSQGDAS